MKAVKILGLVIVVVLSMTLTSNPAWSWDNDGEIRPVKLNIYNGPFERLFGKVIGYTMLNAADDYFDQILIPINRLSSDMGGFASRLRIQASQHLKSLAETPNFLCMYPDGKSNSGKCTVREPSIVITSPTDSEFPAPAYWWVGVTAFEFNTEGYSTKVELYRNGRLVRNDKTAPYNLPQILPPGRYEFVAVAYNDKGKKTTSKPVTVCVFKE